MRRAVRLLCTLAYQQVFDITQQCVRCVLTENVVILGAIDVVLKVDIQVVLYLVANLFQPGGLVRIVGF